jgi:hypothetical protein
MCGVAIKLGGNPQLQRSRVRWEDWATRTRNRGNSIRKALWRELLSHVHLTTIHII